MSCTRGCCASPAEHFRTVHVAASERKAWRKVTTDQIDEKFHVDMTEHYDQPDRQDVQVVNPPPPTLRMS
jgi:hypothetical protein